MKKIYLMTVFLFSLNLAFSQWSKVVSVPVTSIVAFRVINNALYAASGSNIIYKSSDGGVTWNSVTVSNNLIDITSLIFHNNKIYVGTFSFGVFFSSDDGNTWQNNGTDPKFISGFAIKDDILYASTLGNGVSFLNPNSNSWSSLNNSLPNFSVNVNSIIGSANFLMIAAGSNGTFYKYDFQNSNWNEGYYDGILHPAVQISKLVNDADTILAVNFNRINTSTDAGLNWTNDKLGSHDGAYRTIYSGINDYYTLTDMVPTGTWIQQRKKNAATGSTWNNNEEFLPDGFAYDIIEFNNKLFLGKEDGLYFKELTSITLVHFIFFNAMCDRNKVILAWKTAQEQSSSHFNIERSTDGIRWTVIGKLPAARNSNTEKSYSYTDNGPAQNAFYRIAQYDPDGRLQYTNVIQVSCSITEMFTLWPNPTKDAVVINIATRNESEAVIKIFDSKGALVKVQKTKIFPGSNQLRTDIRSFANGVYSLHADWNSGQMKKTVKIIKE